MSNHDTKKTGRKGLLFGQLLDRAARGEAKASVEWLRAIDALQGRSRFHAGDIAKKLGIATCSSWTDEERKEERAELTAEMTEPVRITYLLHNHLLATRTDSPRPGLAIILRATRQGNAIKVLYMVETFCNEMRTRERRTRTCTPPSFRHWSDDYFDSIARLSAA